MAKRSFPARQKVGLEFSCLTNPEMQLQGTTTWWNSAVHGHHGGKPNFSRVAIPLVVPVFIDVAIPLFRAFNVFTRVIITLLQARAVCTTCSTVQYRDPLQHDAESKEAKRPQEGYEGKETASNRHREGIYGRVDTQQAWRAERRLGDPSRSRRRRRSPYHARILPGSYKQNHYTYCRRSNGYILLDQSHMRGIS